MTTLFEPLPIGVEPIVSGTSDGDPSAFAQPWMNWFLQIQRVLSTIGAGGTNIITTITNILGGVPRAVAGGTADAITATFSPSITPQTDQTIVVVRALDVNATTAPSFTANGWITRDIKTRGGQPLSVGDIGAVGFGMVLQYNALGSPSPYWELLNPAVSAGVIIGVTFVYMETPSGVIDGVNDTFVLAHKPYPLASCIGYVRQGGVGAFVPMIAGINFTIPTQMYLTDDLGNRLTDSSGNHLLRYVPNIIITTMAPLLNSDLRFSYTY